MRTLIFTALFLIGSLAVAASTEKIQEKASETAKATGDWTSDTKEEFQAKMKADLADLQVQIDSMKEQAATHTGAAKKELDHHLAELEHQKTKVQHRLDRASTTSGRAWEKMKSGIGSAFDELKKGFSQAKKELDSKDAKQE